MKKSKSSKISKSSKKKSNGKQTDERREVLRLKSKFGYYSLHPALYLASVINGIIKTMTGLSAYKDMQDAYRQLEQAKKEGEYLTSRLWFYLKCPFGKNHVGRGSVSNFNEVVDAAIVYTFNRCIAEDGVTIKSFDIEDLRELVGSGALKLQIDLWCDKCDASNHTYLRNIEPLDK